MGRLDSRLSRLESVASEEAARDLSPRDRAFAAALEFAAEEELEELGRLTRECEKPPDPEIDRRFYELWEEMLSRVSSVWASEVRRARDLLLRHLSRLDKEWTAEGRNRSTWLSDREYWLVSTARVNRGAALGMGAPPITDPEEAARVLARIREEGVSTEEVLRIIGRK